MGANTRWIVYGYKLSEVEIEVSALTYSDAMEVAQSEGLLKPYDAINKDYEESSDE